MIRGFRRKLLAGQTLHGTMLTLPSASVAEILADAGFDWLFIDCEHGPVEVRDIQQILQAVGHRIACIVRIPECSEGTIKRVLDAGAQGIIVPQVNSAATAREVVRCARYAPLGGRGVGIGRAQGYGARFSQYVQEANDEVIVVVQAEHRDAVAGIEEIVAVPGIDCILLGPYDLSASFNRMGQIHDREVVEAIEKVLACCRHRGLPTGYFGVTADAVLEYQKRGCSLLVTGVDVTFLASASARMFRQLTEPTSQEAPQNGST
ncbi:MAG TPA: 2,4-dihydroxyhept-2-ene-1,7-dioic acid aldolase [Planctomycetaceae bacterium]|jgi:2-dehydro-3-deoxyglucarate aldolase/4-hydroxy-2-oxoheptanedioate aldolase|nr:2,4-dihydroxyhept-2-ene-1,7-dioic acid aldolase [Planctomycetaceae bacterium]